MVMPRIYTPVAPVYGGGGFVGLTTLIFMVAFAAVVVQSVGSAVGASSAVGGYDDPPTTVTTVKVGLLSSARDLQADLDALTRVANTSSARGLAEVLREVSVALVRNPDYWSHAAISSVERPLSGAESEFGSRSLSERVKLEDETLSNVAGRGVRTSVRRRRPGEEDLLRYGPGEYIVVTLVVAATGGLARALPKRINNVTDLRRALTALAGVGTDDVQACEVLWAPQEGGDTLTEREMLTDHPELLRIG